MKLRVSVALALPHRQEVVDLVLAPGATVADAIAAARFAERFPGLDLAAFTTGVWSRPRPADTALRDGDRVELYRPLEADAKAQRRARARLKAPPARPRGGG